MLPPIDPKVMTVVQGYRQITIQNSAVWNIRNQQFNSREEASINLQTGLDVLGNPEFSETFQPYVKAIAAGQSVSAQEAVDLMLLSVRDDIAQCFDEAQKQFLHKIHCFSLKTGVTDACCVNQTLHGHPLNYFLIFVNEGLYFTLYRVFTALILEELQGQVATLKRDGTEYFQSALTLYTKPTSVNMPKLELDFGDPAVEGMIQSYIVSPNALVLQFVVLHEYAHAWLGHHPRIKQAQKYLVGTDTNTSEDPTLPSNFTQEYEADAFALRSLVQRTSSIDGQWGNFYAISLFFTFLKAVEERIGHPISFLHPPPQARLNALKIIMMEIVGDSPQANEIETRLNELYDKWMH